MTSISTYGQFMRMQKESLRIQTRNADLEAQSASGKKGTTLGDLGTAASASVNIRSVLGQVDTYKKNIDSVELRASVMDTAMSRMNDIMNQLRDEYTKVGNDLSSHDTTFLNELGKRGLDELKGLLNTQVEGRYVFAANDVQTAPVSGFSGLLDRYQGQVDSYSDPTVSGDAVASNMQAAVGDVTQRYAPATDSVFSQSLQYAGPPMKARVDANRDISYGVRADAQVFQDMIQSLATAATVKYDPNNEDAFKTVLKSGDTTMRSALDGIETEQGKLGLVRKEIQTLSDKHDTITTAFKTELGTVEDVDYAELSTKLKLSDSALQTTYQIIGSMGKVSLLNYLS